MLNCELKPHPDFRSGSVETIQVYGDSDGRTLVLSYCLTGETPLIPPKSPATRADGLWRTTCFEAFVKETRREEYVEFNFSPSTQWAAYSFTRYREGRRDLVVGSPPRIEPIEHGVRVAVDVASLSGSDWRLGLSAVIEATDGSKSYWALAHAPGPPDFHNPDCFIATLPAPEAA